MTDSEVATKAGSSSVVVPPAPGADLDLRDDVSNDLVTDHGKTSIVDSVVSKVAGIAAEEIDGVHAMGSTGARVIGAVRDKVGQTAHAQGVSVEVGERQAAIDLTLVVEYDVSIVDLAEGVRENVTDRVESMTGLEVTEVNIDVVDVYIPGTEESDGEPQPDPCPEPPRVR